MALTSAEAEVRIVPTMRGFGEKVRAGVRSTRVDPLEIQVKLDRRSLDQAEQAARQAAANVAKARQTEQRASEDLRLAEARLAEARKSSAAGSATLIAAENRLEQAKRASVAASTAVQRAHVDEARSTAAAVSANERLEASQRRLQRSTTGVVGALRSVRSVMSNLGDNGSIDKTERAMSRAVSSAARLGTTATVAATALVGIGGAAGPVLALAGALVSAAGSAALIPAALAGAGASFGALKLGLTGISDAFKESGKAAAASGAAGAKSAQEQIQRARTIRDAQQAVTDAVRNQVRVRADGARSVSDAVRRSQEAEERYKEAVVEATRAIRDLNVELKSSALSVEEAELNLDRAKQRLQELKAAGNANPLDLREAELSVRRANISLEEAKNRYTDVGKEAAYANKTGVAGAKNVIDAQRGVQDANRAVADAQRNSAEANEAAARQVRDAVERLQDAYAQTGSSASAAADKANAAMSKLSGNAQAFVRAVLGMKGAWDAMQRSVQDRLFANTAQEVKLLGDKYMPILKQRLGDIAGSFNRAALETSGFLRTSQGVRMVDTTLANTSKTTDQLARAAAPLTNIFLRFSEIGSAYLPQLASKFADAAERAAAFVNSAEGAQKIRGWIEGGLQALSQLWQLLKNVGGIVGGVFNAMNIAGASTLQMLVDITGQARAWVESAEGQRTLVTIFTTIRDVVNELKPGVAAVLGALKDAFLTLAPSLPGAATAFSNIAEALAPIAGWIATGLKWLIDNVLIPLGEWAKNSPGSFQAVAIAVGAVVLSIKALNMAKKVMDWATGIGNAFGVIRRDADKASDAVGRDAKSGLRGRLGALKSIGKIAITIAVIYEFVDAIGGAFEPTDTPDAPWKSLDTDKNGQQSDSETWEAVKGGKFGEMANKVKKDIIDSFKGQNPEDAAVGKWLDDNIGTPVGNFFKELPGKIGRLDDHFGGLFGGGGEGGKPPAQASMGGGGGGSSIFSGLLPKEGVSTWFSNNVGTPVSDFFTNLPSTIDANVLTPAFNGIKDAWNGALWVMKWTWENVLKPAWDGLVFVATWIFYNVLLPIWEGMKSAWNGLLFAMKWVWDNILKPAWDGVAFVASWLYYNVLLPIWNGMKYAWDALLFGMKWTWDNILKPAWDGIVFVATWLYYNVLLPIWNAMKAAWNGLLFAMKWVWDFILKPAWDAIAFAANWLWINVLLPVWNAMKAAWFGLLAGMKWVWDFILKPVWDAIAFAANWLWVNVLLPIWNAMKWAWDGLARAFQWVYDNIIAPVFRFFEDTANKFSTKFHEIVDGLKRKWDELREAFRGPVNWVIDIVYNRGIGGLWGKARELIPSLPEFHKADTFARGGAVRGPGTATSDSIPARLSDGEHVLTAREVAAAGGHGAIEQWRQGLLSRNPAQFATGGPVRWNELWDTVRRQFPNATLNSAVRPGDPGEHGAGLAVDLGGPMAAINRWIAGAFPDSHELIYTPGINLFNGRPHRYNAATAAEHFDHVHWARGSKDVNAGVGGSASGVVTNWILDKIIGLYDAITNPIRGLVGSLFPQEVLPHQAARGGVNQMLDGVRDVLFGAAGSFGFVDGGPTSGDMLGNATVIGNVARGLGLGRNAVVVALATALQESGLRNLNYGDRDSLGLFQQRPSQGWGSPAQIMNPSYAASRFFAALRGVRGWERMPVTVAAQRVQRSAFPDAYAKWVGKANQLATQIGFGNGGVIPGAGLRDDKFALVQSGERVLTRSQNDAFEEMVRANFGANAAVRASQGRMDGLQRPTPGDRGQLFGDVHIREQVDMDLVMQRAAFEVDRMRP